MAQYEDILYIGIVNDDSVETEEMAEDARKFLRPEKRFDTVAVDNAMTLTEDDEDAPAKNMRLQTYIMIGEVDLVFCDEEVYAVLQKEYLDLDHVYDISSENKVLKKYGLDGFDKWKLCVVKDAGSYDNAVKYAEYIMSKEEQ